MDVVGPAQESLSGIGRFPIPSSLNHSPGSEGWAPTQSLVACVSSDPPVLPCSPQRSFQATVQGHQLSLTAVPGNRIVL